MHIVVYGITPLRSGNLGNFLLEPLLHFTFDPADAATKPLAEAHALRELPRVLKSLDVL